jgi:very-short-patch-repair endonuclease
MTEPTAVHYGQVELIPNIFCDGYVLDDGTAVLSERGTADLLGMDHAPLKRVVLNWPPKALNLFIDKDFIVVPNLVKVIASNSPHKGRNIVVYTAKMVEEFISVYALGYAHDVLRENQKHIGKRCVILLKALVRSALDTAIKQACGVKADIQQTAQQHYIDVVKLVKEYGFKCSIPNDIAIKKDIAQFLDIPESTLDSFLRKHKDEIVPIKLDRATIRAAGYKASAMNGYHIDDVTKVVLGMDSVIGLQLKKQMFGQVGPFVKPQTAVETQWQEVLSKVFNGFDLRMNYPIGPYKVDFFVAKLMLVLECNGYCHKFYDFKQEKAREELIIQKYGLVRFHHQVAWETLVNGILQAQQGKVIQLYDLEHLGQEMPFGVNCKPRWCLTLT